MLHELRNQATTSGLLFIVAPFLVYPPRDFIVHRKPRPCIPPATTIRLSVIQRMLLWRRLVCSLVNDDPDSKNPSGSTYIPALLLKHCLAPVRCYPASYRRLLAHGISVAVVLTIRDEGSRASCRQDDFERYENGAQATCYRPPPPAEERIDTISVPHNC